MRVVGLVSGGKDSTYNLMQCVARGHEIVALANLRPSTGGELDSYMYQSVGQSAVGMLEEVLGVPLFSAVIEGTAVNQSSVYCPTEGDEVECLYSLLRRVKESVPFEAVSVGAIFSNYQKVRVENVCARLGVKMLAYLWQRDQAELLKEMVDCGIKAIIIKVAALGLEARHLGCTIEDLRPHLLTMERKIGLNICGEGGEYETFTLDCPLFCKEILLDESEVVEHSKDGVAYLNLLKLRLRDKNLPISMEQRLQGVPMKLDQ